MQATFRIPLTTGKNKLTLSRHIKIKTMVLEKWKFENLDISPVPTALTLEFGNNTCLRDEIGNINSNSLQLFWDGVATGYMGGDLDVRDSIQEGVEQNFKEMTVELRDQDGALVTADFLTLWFKIF